MSDRNELLGCLEHGGFLSTKRVRQIKNAWIAVALAGGPEPFVSVLQNGIVVSQWQVGDGFLNLVSRNDRELSWSHMGFSSPMHGEEIDDPSVLPAWILDKLGRK